MARLAQRKRILEHMKTIGPITPLEALELYGCFRLAARIYDLKLYGYRIKTEVKTIRDAKPGEPAVEVALYSLKDDKRI